MKLAGSDLEQRFVEQLWKAGEKTFCQQCSEPYRRSITRNRRFRRKADFAWHAEKVAVEINGGTWGRGKGGHTSGAGVQRDYEKSHDAQLDGWIHLPLDRKQMSGPYGLETLQEALRQRRG
jgi:hypothetical protein